MKCLDITKAHVAIFFKDFAHFCAASCVGLTVAGYSTARFLREHGIDAHAHAVRHNVDVVHAIDKYNSTHIESLTHVVISAPWLSLYDVGKLVKRYRDIKFVILSHSNVGFLQADPHGISLYRQYLELSRAPGFENLQVGGNCAQFTNWFQIAYGAKCVLLPNLYPSNNIRSKIWKRKKNYLLKIGSFGAIRPEKNFMTAAAAAVAVRAMTGLNVELHMSTGGDGCKSTTLPAIVQMTEGIKGFKLIRHDWETWEKFIQLVAKMDVLIQVSYTESFNMITADGISVGVPSVVSPVIWWTPDSWKANPDDAMDVATKTIELVTERQNYVGYKALRIHNNKSLKHWIQFLCE